MKQGSRGIGVVLNEVKREVDFCTGKFVLRVHYLMVVKFLLNGSEHVQRSKWFVPLWDSRRGGGGGGGGGRSYKAKLLVVDGSCKV